VPPASGLLPTGIAIASSFLALPNRWLNASAILKASTASGERRLASAKSLCSLVQSIDISRPYIYLPEKLDIKISVELDLAALVQASFGILLLSNSTYGPQGQELPNF